MRQALFALGLLAVFVLVAVIVRNPNWLDRINRKDKIVFKQEINAPDVYKKLGTIQLSGKPGESLVFKVLATNVTPDKLDQLFLVSEGLRSNSAKIESSEIITSPSVGNYAFSLLAGEAKAFDFLIHLGTKPKGEYRGSVEAVDGKHNDLGQFELKLNII